MFFKSPVFDQTKKYQFFHESESLIQLANALCDSDNPPPIPLRRTLSLLRDFRFGTILCEHNTLESEKLEELNCNCGEQEESCAIYRDNLRKYGYDFLRKECYRLIIFRSMVDSIDRISELGDDDLIAYCIFHKDILLDLNTNETKIAKYVPECIVRFLERRKYSYKFANHKVRFSIDDKIFKIEGTYFSQQNGITTCCAHAAIKMALKPFFHEISGHKINKALGIDHEKAEGNKGLSSEQFIAAIKDVVGLESNYFITKSFNSPLYFSKLIYHAIESRFPVILLFRYPKESFEDEEFITPLTQEGHAAALIGHTFNKNSWWSYGWKNYFSSLNYEFKYLPSFLWCDNFIIHDDNIGPLYYLPVTALNVDISEFSHTKSYPKSRRKRLASSFFQRLTNWLHNPVKCIIVVPEGMSKTNFASVLEIEPAGLEALAEIVDKIKGMPIEPVSNIYYSQYFYPFFRSNSLVLRTYAIRKDEYLNASIECNEKTRIGMYFDDLEDILAPYEFIWLTEIGIPELYWINKFKLGEIVSVPIEPESNGKQKNDIKELIKFIRIPGFMAIKINGYFEPFATNEIESRTPLIEPSCNQCFIRSNYPQPA